VTDEPGRAGAAPSATPHDDHDHDRHHAQQQRSRLRRAAYALHLVIGRGPVARRVANLARLTGADRVVDIGCGPGTAVRIAAARAASATGIDPDPTMLRYARLLVSLRPRISARFVQGSAESLPLTDGTPRSSGRSARCTTGPTAPPAWPGHCGCWPPAAASSSSSG
jgi:SAM-dependent methyltransferase